MPEDASTQKTLNNDLTPQEKLDGLMAIVSKANIAILTTMGTNGQLHSRTMAPASTEKLHFAFLADNSSYKTTEIEKNSSVNVSFYDPSSRHWASIAGTAKLSQDRQKIKDLWNPLTRAWFGDLGDGVHKGDSDDPRVIAIEVVPTYIRYWYTTRSKVGTMVDVAVSAATGSVAAPGETREINENEASTNSFR
ncbi:pyridoxamine 5'-phosphate oxidase family protein [Ceratobasidium sp. AG-Ba]|nr:pyridoxamine 5'-phosphate oxidase family protein [Ceratobasidium sp. AG-Ba]QRW08524.1 pyridoxamine 5'-phosphate oxidase family protein [Ceratobasidium sp. AG-Ba]